MRHSDLRGAENYRSSQYLVYTSDVIEILLIVRPN